MKTYRHFKFGGNIPPLTVTDKSDTPFLGRKIKIRGQILELSLYFTVHGVCSAVALATHTPVMMLQLVTHIPRDDVTISYPYPHVDVTISYPYPRDDVTISYPYPRDDVTISTSA